MFSFRRRVMRTLRVLTYLAVVCAVMGGAAGFVVMAFAPPTVTLAALQETPKTAPGIQASRNALPAEKAKTAALVDQANMKAEETSIDDGTPQATHSESGQARPHRASGAGASARPPSASRDRAPRRRTALWSRGSRHGRRRRRSRPRIRRRQAPTSAAARAPSRLRRPGLSSERGSVIAQTNLNAA